MESVFISYVKEDAEKVIPLAQILKANGINVWIDRESLMPGDFWEDAIRRAIQNGAFFIACFSKNYEKKSKTGTTLTNISPPTINNAL